MITYAPDYYASFACIADQCRHSCCVGWEIDIDDAALARYRSIGGALGELLKANVNLTDDGASFRLDEDERCPFLNPNGLCDLITTLGKDALCEICAEHPRFRNFFESRTEIGLGLCCEEADRLILTHREKTALVPFSDDGEFCERSPEEANFFAFRDQVLALLQDRTHSISDRFTQTLALVGISPEAILADDKRWAAVYRTLEQLDPAWGRRLAEWQAHSLPMPILPDTPEVMVALEQLAVYFIYRHLADAIDDGRYAERVAFSLLSTRTVAALAALEAARQGSDLLAALLEVARCYSAEVEYSTENVEALLCELEKCVK